VPHDGFFAPDSALRQVISETLVGLSAPRVLLMQAAHPVAFAGFFAHTGALDAPYERLDRTALIMNTVAFGTREHAERATARVRAMHTRVTGVLEEPAGRWPAGTPYSATDPGLLLWILATLMDSATFTYERWVGRLDRDFREALWADYRVVGALFGLQDADMPADLAAFEAYWEAVQDDLFVTAEARRLGREIVLHPPLPRIARPAVELLNQVTIGSLPPHVRRGYGLRWDPLRGVALRVAEEYVRRVVRPLLPDPLRRIGVARNGLPLERQRAAANLRDRAHVAA
jgi:uncharacterized protein (DUF2236 family)